MTIIVKENLSYFSSYLKLSDKMTNTLLEQSRFLVMASLGKSSKKFNKIYKLPFVIIDKNSVKITLNIFKLDMILFKFD